MMRWKRNKKQKRSGIDLAEEALYLLRHSPAPIVFSYLIGSIPFVHGLLYFWTDMSRSPVAAKHVGQAAFGMAALYVWMKLWHSVFSIRLLSNLRGEFPERFSASRIFRIITAQLSVQPYSLFLIPFCLLAFLPFPMALAFFHTFSITGDGVHNDLRSALKRAWSLSGQWHGQNNGFVFLMIVFSLAVFAGIGILMIFIPSLIDTLFGVESVFTRGGLIPMMNSTFFAIVAALNISLRQPDHKNGLRSSNILWRSNSEWCRSASRVEVFTGSETPRRGFVRQIACVFCSLAGNNICFRHSECRSGKDCT